MREYRFSLVLLITVLYSVGLTLGQGLTVQNPSFEGTSAPHVLPAPWVACFGSPDTQPGQWGINQPASDGNTYISMLQSGQSANGYQEGATQQLSGCMQAGTDYTFQIDLAFSSTYNTAEPNGCYGSFQIFGGNLQCGTNELLWQSGQITHTGWQTYSVTITPTQNWCYITFSPYFITSCGGYVNIMADNIQPIVPAVPGIQIVTPTLNEDIDCQYLVTGTTDSVPTTVTVSGGFIGSPLPATINGTNWEVWVSYPPNYTGAETIWAEGLFPDNSTARDSVDFNVVSPVANFAFNDECLGTPISFTDQSIFASGTITSWNWDFGDGNTSDQQNPTHSYAAANTYNVTLSVQSDDGCNGNVTIPVTVYPNPTADFTFDDVCIGQTTTFTDASLGNGGTIDTWVWDFGDGNTSNIQSPTHTYATEAVYDVMLTVTTTDGCQESITQQVTVSPLPVADFTFTDECLSVANTFTDQSVISSGNIQFWTWDFGDGGTSGQQNPTHQYSVDGTYDVILEVEGPGGCADSDTQQVTVFPAPLADFDAPIVCFGEVTDFADLTVINNAIIDTWLWDFGDGNTSNQQNPSHTYQAPNTYSVTLTVSSDNGCVDDTTINAIVNVVPEASYTFTDVCEDSVMTFINNSNDNGGVITGYLWDFGDFANIPALPNSTSTLEDPTFTYLTSGVYDVTLTVSAGTCSDDTVQQVLVFPNPNARFDFTTVCFGDITEFTDMSTSFGGDIDTWIWDFDDGNTSNSQNPQNNYAGYGWYNVNLVVSTDKGCVDEITQPVRVHATPIAEFDGTNVCFDTLTTFTDLSTIPGDNIESYNWDFGDGNSSDAQSPTHTYATTGPFDVILTVTSDSGCVDDITHTVNVYPYPEPDFIADPLEGCQPLRVQFTDKSTISSGSNVSFLWDLGNNSVTNSQFPGTVYTQDGTFDVTLTVTSNYGCDTSITKEDYITVYPLPKAGFIHEPDTFVSIFDPEFQFYDKSSGADSIVIYEFGDGESAFEPDPLHVYPDTGFYHVTQYVYTTYGCGDTTDAWVRVRPEFALYIPNTFTPNSDGINDAFEVKGIGVLEYSLRIFNRWGEQIYHSNDMSKFWDGKIRDTIEPAKEDVYVYTIFTVDVNYEEHSFKGHVTILR